MGAWARLTKRTCPSRSQAKDELVRGLEKWDAEAADSAVAALCRSAGAAETMEPLCARACAISAISVTRRFSRPSAGEPCRRSAGSTPSPCCDRSFSGCSTSAAIRRPRPVGPYETNLENAAKIRPEWTIGRDDPAATQALLQVMRQATPEAASAEAVKLLNQGIAPGSLWDAAILAACELIIHSPGIVAIHATTATNALHYIYTASGDDTTRRLALLQAVGWQPMYRGRVKLTDSTGIDSLKANPDVQVSGGDEAVGEIFATINEDRTKAGTKAHGLSGPRGLARPHLRRRPAHDLPQRPR